MLAIGTIGEAPLSADAAATPGTGGVTVNEGFSEAVAFGDALSAFLAMAASLAEGTIVAELSATSGPAANEGIVGSISLSASYAPGGFWMPKAASAADWLVVSPDQGNWVVVAAGDDSWTRQ